MNTIGEHLEKARHNLAFLNTIDVAQDTFADWATVVLFYRALHLVSAVIHNEGRDHGTNHPERLRQAKKTLSMSGWQHYGHLYTRSRVVRYDDIAATASEYERLLHSSFEPLFHEVQSFFPHAT